VTLGDLSLLIPASGGYIHISLIGTAGLCVKPASWVACIVEFRGTGALKAMLLKVLNVNIVIVPDICEIICRGIENERTSGKKMWQEERRSY